jgi:hypothetical protein
MERNIGTLRGRKLVQFAAPTSSSPKPLSRHKYTSGKRASGYRHRPSINGGNERMIFAHSYPGEASQGTSHRALALAGEALFRRTLCKQLHQNLRLLLICRETRAD